VQDGKKKKFDGMGEKFATAAVGGAGFGVGSALAGGLVNASEYNHWCGYVGADESSLLSDHTSAGTV
jgi:hypothetical protein